MVWEKDQLRPTQPYFVFDTQGFRQEIYLRQGISHFYTFRLTEKRKLRTVPDGCIDLFFEYTNDGMHGYACGTPTTFGTTDCDAAEVFGVRFMPGMQPELLSVTMRELLGQRLPLEDVLSGDRAWLGQLAAETDFYQRIRVFIEHFTIAEKRRTRPYGKAELVWSVKKMVYESDGRVKVQEMQERTGYTDRYINKVFLDEMGFSPKTFCKIIQFQRALEFLNYGSPDKMTDAAVSLGYYDQPQFIRDFTRYAGTTPRRYQKLVEEQKYRERIETNGNLGG